MVGADSRIADAALHAAIAADRLRIVATLIRVTGDWALAEDCVQDAVERALRRWPHDGVPDRPAAWLTTTARRRAIDVLRRRRIEHEKLRDLQALDASTSSEDPDADGVYGDDQLGLLFACCHPALPPAGRVALTLTTVAGLSTRQVARALLVSEPTMGQRLLRTKRKIAHSGISLRLPEPHRLRERTAGVLAVIYLLFNEGYAATEGERLLRDDLAAEAVRLSGLTTRLLPADAEVLGLRALLLLQHARRAARVDAHGDVVVMAEQDRALWDADEIADGLSALAAARAFGSTPGPYLLQAEIAAVHATAPDAAGTDWARIVTRYDALLALRHSAVVALNRAVAVGFRDGPEAGLAALARVAAELPDYPLLPAVRADLLRRAGRLDDAAADYRLAVAAAATDPERRFLRRRLDEVTADAPLPG